jgi:hypothetical protein
MFSLRPPLLPVKQPSVAASCRNSSRLCILPPMFRDCSAHIENNIPRLSYGVAVTDIDGDGLPEFVVAGFGTSNLVLDWQSDRMLRDIAPPIMADPSRRAIGVAAGDVNGDGQEEIYFLNTDTFMGMKRFGDRFFVHADAGDAESWFDLFELPVNVENPNLNAGRSVAVLDIDGQGVYRVFVANYGGPMRVHRVDSRMRVDDTAEELGIRLATGGRSLCVIPDLGPSPAVFCGNENDSNALFVRSAGGDYGDRAGEFGVSASGDHARGVALSDLDGDGLLDLVVANWDGPVRFFTRENPGDVTSPYIDRAPAELHRSLPHRTVIAADFDNDGYEELFFNTIGAPNRLFRVRDGAVEEIEIGDAREPDGLGTGAAVADVNGDGILELLVAHGETEEQSLSLYADGDADKHNYLRVAPLTDYGAPARGAVVRLFAGGRRQVRAIDGGSGYLCQMEPVAHFGLGSEDSVDAIEIVWPGGRQRRIEHPGINREIEVTP